MPWIVHGFRGGEELARQLLSHGLYLSFGEKFHEESLRAAWPDHLFAETDESSLTISAIYDKLSTAVPVNVETFAEQMEKNFEEVFG